MGVLDAVAKKAQDVKDAVSSTVSEYKGLGKEFQGKASQMSDSAPAAKPAAAAAPAKPAPAAKKYGSGPGEKRIDVTDMVKPLGSYEKGTPYVPKTGIYQLHEGEAVTPKEKNPMNAMDAMSKIAGKQAKPEKKIHKITTHKTDDGKLIHTHMHHHSNHHPDETHVSNNIDEAQEHMAAMEPQMSAQAPPMPEQGGGEGAPSAM